MIVHTFTRTYHTVPYSTLIIQHSYTSSFWCTIRYDLEITYQNYPRIICVPRNQKKVSELTSCTRDGDFLQSVQKVWSKLLPTYNLSTVPGKKFPQKKSQNRMIFFIFWFITLDNSLDEHNQQSNNNNNSIKLAYLVDQSLPLESLFIEFYHCVLWSISFQRLDDLFRNIYMIKF